MKKQDISTSITKYTYGTQSFVPVFGDIDIINCKDACDFWEKLYSIAYQHGITKGKRLKEQEIKKVLNIQDEKI